MNKGLAFLFFLSSALAAFCVSLLCYTFVTGDLPFNITPMTSKVMKKVYNTKAEIKTDNQLRQEMSPERISEAYLRTFYTELIQEREKLAREKEKLAEKERNVTEVMAQVRLMQEKIADSEQKARKLLDFIDAKQQENLRRTAKMISGMDPASAGKMLMQWDEKKAAEVMYFVNDKISAKIISGLLENKDKETLKKTERLVQLIEKVSEDPNTRSEQ